MEIIKNLLSFGNTKIPKSTAIFNMGPAFKCPSDELGLCAVSEICYAKKAERLYKGCTPYRERQMDYWLDANSNKFVNQFMDAVTRKRHTIDALRINESGDFWSQECVDKLDDVAGELASNDIVTYTYTARKDLSFNKLKHAKINGSGFTKPGINNIFVPVEAYSGNHQICEGDCRKCNLCYGAECITIEAKKH